MINLKMQREFIAKLILIVFNNNLDLSVIFILISANVLQQNHYQFNELEMKTCMKLSLVFTHLFYEFDVLVRFENDSYQYSFNEDGTISLDNVKLIEVV